MDPFFNGDDDMSDGMDGSAPDDVRAALEAAMESVGGDEGIGGDSLGNVGEASAGAQAAQVVDEAAPSGAPRDEAGRFKPAAPNDELPAVAADAAPSADVAPPFTPPEGLDDNDRAALAALSPEARTVAAGIISRQREAFAEQARDITVERQFYGALRQPMQAVAGFSEHFKAHPAAVISAWAEVQRGLLTDPVTALRGLAQQFGVDPAALVGDPPSPQDMALRETQRKLRELESFADRQSRMQAEQEQMHQRRVMEETTASITAFAAEKGPDGQPLRPHFATLREEMANLITAGRAKDLFDAYDKAVWSNPTTRADMLRRETAKSQAAEQAARALQAAKARAAGGSVVGSPGAAVTPAVKPAASVEEAVRLALQAQSGGV
jgi:hypothetical protein